MLHIEAVASRLGNDFRANPVDDTVAVVAGDLFFMDATGKEFADADPISVRANSLSDLEKGLAVTGDAEVEGVQ